jgi:UDP-N-acetyl-2-amino-2-deoxyglucuronate dehydrogenase
MLSFALIGAAGYIAPRHMAAIRDTGHRLVAAFDPFDSVGILDKYFPEASFFTTFERFERFLERLKLQGNPVDFLVVCSPNYLHDSHIRFGLRLGAHVICEKPLVLNPHNLEALAIAEKESDKKVFTLLQLRHHPVLQDMHTVFSTGMHNVTLTYITGRGQWYHTSWKGDIQKSGGISTNIGIHLFDMLLWLFGPCAYFEVHLHTHDRAAGFLVLERAKVKWFLSIDADTLPPEVMARGGSAMRVLESGDQVFEFTEGFNQLHSESYREILAGRGFGIEEVRPSVLLAASIRNTTPLMQKKHAHPLATLPGKPHPFVLGG